MSLDVLTYAVVSLGSENELDGHWSIRDPHSASPRRRGVEWIVRHTLNVGNFFPGHLIPSQEITP